jgi:NAD(P)-dependent dehydrogenase (short-subunit alcohol dehydrogenase family)
MSKKNLFSLAGKVCVIIGGTGELCGAIGEGFAAAGGRVVLVGRDAEKAASRLAIIRAAGNDAVFEPAEADNKASLSALLERVVKSHGQVDVVMNGAGINSSTPFFDISEEEFHRIMRVNLTGVFLGCQVFGKYFMDHKRPGSIINVGSEAGLKPLSRVFTYSCSKAAVHNLSLNLAREWAPYGVRVNVLVPGFIPAQQNRAILNPERVSNIMRQTPMRRFGEAHELIGAALLLATDAGGFITGSELVVDGGYQAMSI